MKREGWRVGEEKPRHHYAGTDREGDRASRKTVTFIGPITWYNPIWKKHGILKNCVFLTFFPVLRIIN